MRRTLLTMAFKSYNYGGKKKEITALLRRRLALRDKIRYHNSQVEKFEKELPIVEKKLDELLKQADN